MEPAGSEGRSSPIRATCRPLSPVPGRVKGLVLTMLASLRVAPVPLRAFDPPCAPGEPDRRSAPRNGPFDLTKECSMPATAFDLDRGRTPMT